MLFFVVGLADLFMIKLFINGWEVSSVDGKEESTKRGPKIDVFRPHFGLGKG